MQFERTDLHDAVSGGAVAIRMTVALQPAGGQGDKIFPPTYSVNNGIKYALEGLSEDQQTAKRVLLDSVASQANRAEQALLRAMNTDIISFPSPYVDFTDFGDITDYERISVLDAPHRIADAIFRDSLLNDTLFRLTDEGVAITEATPRNASALYYYSPTALLFGMWDSTGPKGGMGSRFQRAYVSEIMGHGVQLGKKVESRIDPLAIETLADEDKVFNHKDPAQVWTIDKEDAATERGKLKLAGRRSGDGNPGQPSKINHGNIVPSIDSDAGGVIVENARQVVTISFPALRRLGFRGVKEEAAIAARTAIAAIGLCAMTLQHESDYDLRSRCLLIPDARAKCEMLYRNGETADIDIDSVVAANILRDATQSAKDMGIGWNDSEMKLVPSGKLIELIRRSRDKSAVDGE